jgi:ubiquinone/menaquinone biosynthesis C-methylase UbiE
VPVGAMFRTPDWFEVRLDINPDVQPDVVADITNMPIIESSSVDALWSSHNLEHVFAHQVSSALSEFFRVLAPGAVAHVQVPDVMTPVRAIMKGRLEQALYEAPAGPVTPLDMLFGFGPAIERGEHHMAHRTAFTRETLSQKFRVAGFEDVKVVSQDDALRATGRRPLDT